MYHVEMSSLVLCVMSTLLFLYLSFFCLPMFSLESIILLIYHVFFIASTNYSSAVLDLRIAV